MKILFDQGTPAPLREYLSNHLTCTAYEMGWSTLSNGDLLTVAEQHFDALITTDKNLVYQQNLSGRKIAILILPFASWPRLRSLTASIVCSVNGLQPGDCIQL